MILEKLTKLGEMPIIHNYNKAVPLPFVSCPTLFYGVELEIESVMDPDAWVVPGFHHEEDGSLRNSGREFITKPMTLSNLAYGLDLFKTKSGVTDKNYSERTSIHVHTNARNLTLEQIQTILVLYQLFERMLFRFAGNDRDKNIFCVPWNQTLLNHKIMEGSALPKFKAWQKYTALNLLPLLTQGTLEWRHMPGHCDFKKLVDWCNIIGCFFAWVQDNSLEDTINQVIALNTNSEYEAVFGQCFGPLAGLLWGPSSRELLEEGVLDVKLTILTRDQTKKKAAQKVEKFEPWVIPAVPGPGAVEDNRRFFFNNPMADALRPVNADVERVRAQLDRLNRQQRRRMEQAARAAEPRDEMIFDDVVNREEPL
jgi:hypothetical protein